MNDLLLFALGWIAGVLLWVLYFRLFKRFPKQTLWITAHVIAMLAVAELLGYWSLNELLRS